AEAFAAAYGAYLRAGNDAERIEALSLLGNMLVREIEERPASDSCRPYKDAGDGSAGAPVDRETAKRLAHEVFTAAGKLASDGRFKQPAGGFAQQAGQLVRQPLRLDGVTYPPPRPGGSRTRCPALTELVQPSSGDGNVLSSGSVGCQEEARNVCLRFTQTLDLPLKDLAAKIRIERSPPTPQRT